MTRIDYLNDPNAPAPNSIVPAASAVVTNDAGEILLQRRTDNDLWALPGGTMDLGERIAETVVREVREETGLVCELGEELPETRYTDSKGRPKRVRWWRMRAVMSEPFPADEVDEVRWLAPAAADELLSYEHDRELLRAVAA